jgi:predicted enzyme involved in methoxymalonyl-ACP biosynthesis
VLGKTVEFALMEDIIKQAKRERIKKITGTFVQTAKNKPAEMFLKDCGFVLEGGEDGVSNYVFEVGLRFKGKICAEVIEWKG